MLERTVRVAQESGEGPRRMAERGCPMGRRSAASEIVSVDSGLCQRRRTTCFLHPGRGSRRQSDWAVRTRV